MNLQTVELPEEIINRAKALTGKRTARAAMTALVEHAGNIPNPPTARSLRAKGREHSFKTAKAATAFLRARYR